MLEAIGSLLLSLGITGAEKLLNKLKVGMTDEELASLATKVMNAASAKGSNMLSKATDLLGSIPQISGSAALSKYVNQARWKASQNMKDVEDKVNNIQNNASDVAANLTNLQNRSIATKYNDQLDPNSKYNEAIDNANKALASYGASQVKKPETFDIIDKIEHAVGTTK